MRTDPKSQAAYNARRSELYKSEDKAIKKRFPKMREPISYLQPATPFHTSTREWIDTPEDRAEVAAILNKSTK